MTMASKKLDVQKLGAVFESRPDILQGIKQAADSPSRVALFNEIAAFVHDQLHGGANSSEPAAKRRRIDDGQTNGSHPGKPNGAASGSSAANSFDAAAKEPVLLEIKEISLSIPQRKKFDLCFTQNYLYARAPNTSGPVQGIVYAWNDIEHAFYLPVPEKTQPQHNYVLFPRGTCLLAASAPTKATAADNNGAAATTAAPEPLVFTIPATAPKTGTVAGPMASKASAVSDSYSTLLNWALTTHLRGAGNSSLQIVAADPRIFHSEVRQSHRPSEKAVHVKAFRGSKDGFLFFLPTGILWGFKKPLLFLPLDRVVAVSYTNVLQRTFNVLVEVDVGGEKSEEVEFGMLDQEDYSTIDVNYVKRHRLQDRSMAEQRKAKRELAENADAKKGGGAAGAAGEDVNMGGVEGEDDGLTELERAQRLAEQQLQDEEDEDEEDYNPDSEDDSDGSGESSDEDDEDGDGEGGEEDDDEDEEDGEGESEL